MRPYDFSTSGNQLCKRPRAGCLLVLVLSIVSLSLPGCTPPKKSAGEAARAAFDQFLRASAEGDTARAGKYLTQHAASSLIGIVPALNASADFSKIKRTGRYPPANELVYCVVDGKEIKEQVIDLATVRLTVDVAAEKLKVLEVEVVNTAEGWKINEFKVRP